MNVPSDLHKYVYSDEVWNGNDFPYETRQLIKRIRQALYSITR